MTDIDAERLAFDNQIKERAEHGHIPDLRHSGRCEWFYCNPWRDNAFIQMVEGERFRSLVKNLPAGIRILEVGMGPGALSLELARAGFDVTGIDISGECVSLAHKTSQLPSKENFNLRLRHIQGDFLTRDWSENFDAVVFSGAFHHFPQPEEVAKKAAELLTANGIVVLMEPCRELIDHTTVAIRYLVESLLGATGKFWTAPDLLSDQAGLQAVLDHYLMQTNYRDEAGENVQSPLDMSCTREQMLAALEPYFSCIQQEWEYSFFADIIGGLRISNREEEVRIARHLEVLDQWLLRNEMIKPSNFRWFGKCRGVKIKV